MSEEVGGNDTSLPDYLPEEAPEGTLLVGDPVNEDYYLLLPKIHEVVTHHEIAMLLPLTLLKAMATSVTEFWWEDEAEWMTHFSHGDDSLRVLSIVDVEESPEHDDFNLIAYSEGERFFVMVSSHEIRASEIRGFMGNNQDISCLMFEYKGDIYSVHHNSVFVFRMRQKVGVSSNE